MPSTLVSAQKGADEFGSWITFAFEGIGIIYCFSTMAWPIAIPVAAAYVGACIFCTTDFSPLMSLYSEHFAANYRPSPRLSVSISVMAYVMPITALVVGTKMPELSWIIPVVLVLYPLFLSPLAALAYVPRD